MAPPRTEDPILFSNLPEKLNYGIFVSIVKMDGSFDFPFIEQLGDLILELNQIFYTVFFQLSLQAISVSV